MRAVGVWQKYYRRDGLRPPSPAARLLANGSGAPAGRPIWGSPETASPRSATCRRSPESDVASVIDATGHVVSPGFVDPHGHSDGYVFLDGALVSHLRQGYTTQLSGNCGYTFAPMTGAVRAMLDADLAHLGLDPGWTTFGDYLDEVERQPMGPNVALLVGHGTIRWAAMGPDGRAPTPAELGAMVRYVDEALDAGAIGVSSGLIYAPGVHAAPDEVAALVAVAARRGALYATHMRNESAGVLDSMDEAISTTRAAGDLAGRPARLQVSHLKAGAHAVWGTAERWWSGSRRPGAPASTSPPTSIRTPRPRRRCRRSCLPRSSPCRSPTPRRRSGTRPRATIRDLMRHGVSGWENVALDPGWEGIVISRSGSGRNGTGARSGPSPTSSAATPATSPSTSSPTTGCPPRSSSTAWASRRREIMRVPWIGVCTDAEGRRPGHRILGQGVPHPRTYGSTARVLGHYVRDRGIVDLETAVAKLSAVPAARVGLRDRGVLREGCLRRRRGLRPRRPWPTSPPTIGRPSTRRGSGT